MKTALLALAFISALFLFGNLAQAQLGPGFGGTPIGPGFNGRPMGPGFNGTARGPGFQGTPGGVGFQGQPRGPGFSPSINSTGFNTNQGQFRQTQPRRSPQFNGIDRGF